ncbi:MAG: carbohydrate kinase family protein [Chloroflexi bacterium]|nr:carbohydrate kinase family protein [Chloroflexota bacterium]
MNILITGSVAYDYLMTFPGQFKEHILPDQLDSISLSFLVDSLNRRRGGIAANIAYNLALLGVRARVFATIGADYQEDRDWLESQGVDTSTMTIIPDTFTASLFATTDNANAQIASFYPGAMAHASELSLHDLDGSPPDLVLVSPNDPTAMDQYIAECKQLHWPYVYDPSQQVVRVDGKTLREGIQGAHSLFANEYEFSLIKKKTGMDMDDINEQVGFVVITHGDKGSSILNDDNEYHIPAVPTDNIVDPTGGGDAFRGGFLAGYSRGWDLDICGKIGSLAATICLESDGPQGHSFERADFVARFREHFDDFEQLDELIKI